MVQGSGQHFHPQGQGGGFKVLADTGGAVLVVNERVVVGGVDLDLHVALHKLHRVQHRPVHTAGTAEAEGILEGTIGIGPLQITALQIAQALGGALALAAEAAGIVGRLPHGLKAAVQPLQAQAKHRIGLPQQLPCLNEHHRYKRFALGVGRDNGQPVLWPQYRRSNPLRSQRLAGRDNLPLVLHLALADHGLADKGQGTDIPLPDGSPLKDPGMDAPVQKKLIHG